MSAGRPFPGALKITVCFADGQQRKADCRTGIREQDLPGLHAIDDTHSSNGQVSFFQMSHLFQLKNETKEKECSAGE